MDIVAAKQLAGSIVEHASIRRVRCVALLGLMVWGGGLTCGCKSKSEHATQNQHAPLLTPSELTSPVVRASENGLEVAWWVVASNQAAITAAMAPYLNRPVPLDDQTRALWEANGLRIVAVPVAKLEDLRQSMSIIGAVQRQWLGQTPMWTDTVNGPIWYGNRAIALDSGRLALGSGRLRLLTRCWTVPVPVQPQEVDPSPAAALHIELVPQHLEAAGSGTAGAQAKMQLTPVSDTSDPLADGLVFRRLLAEMTVAQGDAYIIIPQQLGADWTVAREGDEQPPREGGKGGGGESGANNDTVKSSAQPPVEKGAEQPALPAGATGGTATNPAAASPYVPGIGRVARETDGSAPPTPTPSADDEAALSHGPPEAPAMTLGEALLTTTGARDPKVVVPDPGTKGVYRADRPARAILVFIPRVPDRFRLIGR